MNNATPPMASLARGIPPRGWGLGLAYVLVVAGLVVLVVVAAVIAWLTLSIDRTAITSRQLLDWREAGYQIMSALQDAETGQRGYLLTNDKAYLQPYQSALEQLPAQLQVLRELTPDQIREQASIAELEKLIDSKLAELKQTVALRDQGSASEAIAIINRDVGRRIMDAIRDRIATLRDEQTAELDAARDKSRMMRQWLLRGAIVAILLSGILALAGLLLMRRQLAVLKRDTQSLGIRKVELEAMVAERTANLEEARAELLRERDQVKALLRDMNHRVGNSLQLVSSFLSLQARKTRDPGASQALRSAQARVQAVALAQRRLRLSDTGPEDMADATQLLTGLLDDIRASSVAGAPITLELEAEPFIVKSQDAVSIGVIVGELVNNAMKYALPNGLPGTIWVRLAPAKKDSQATLIVEDDGIGFVESPEGAGGLGSEVVNALAMGLNATVARETPRPGEPRPGHRVVLTLG
ncbi:MAG: CHASE3 domain-containing protein [Hyphomicrobiales bacterium]